MQASNGQPVAGAIVELPGGSSQMVTQSTDSSGNATLNQVVIGTHTAIADAPGLHGEATVSVVENQTVSVRVPMNPTQ
ncbi:MAG: carboxypeptidase regulatory-like domain-containing protein [Candidatus Eremiobacteraeota bacterium]|nr:carboxypeptidase regulatory-like domain-containing protein [Candidatus Eremiobacteraeota bacterium]MBV8263381.1 carboxypeptidase regulatory-like domain-containing protein [Candidatus Eremiobacteraeota bacterium]MBV8459733.1 carboxypeptidase regulatory-like domain-containing protein [Candidatus Eremiobacteraeota bacterium]MBV8596581.1 carboxypeptidase regulatory-like domain-containing protein [Candidatus Eremiobacteraeota bacterium]MBV8671204.1 carboxypeptidase regulatory-like domain-containi